MKRFALAIGLIAGCLWESAPAEAQLELCNRTSYILYAAVAADGRSETTAQGWTRIVPGECKTAIDSPLGKTAYYTYARTSAAHGGPQRAWAGGRQFCALDSNFKLVTPWTATRCQAEEATMLPFARIETKGQPVWAMTFTESKDIATVDAARIAGLKRLLRDNGMKIANADGKPDKQTEEALNSFRKRMNIAPDAVTRDTFDALETEALKSAAPAGYSICNDTDAVVWAALAFAQGRDWMTRGWWKVAAGTCAKAMTQPLNLDRVFLHAEKHGNDKLVSGPEKFCLTNIEFEIQGRGGCAKRRLNEVGFAATATKGLTGYTAHIGNQGLMPPLRTRPK